MKRLLVLSIFLLIVVFSYTAVAQEMGSIRKSIEYSFPEKIHKLILDPLPAGTYSIGTGGYFATIQSAFDKLSTDGIAGEVILELTDNLYTAPTDDFGFFLNGPITGAGPNSRVTIKPAANENVTIEGNGLVTVSLLNTSYVTIDGVAITGSTTLTIHTLSNNAYDYDDGIDFFNNSDHNVIQNIVFIDEAGVKPSGSGFVSDNLAALAPDSNIIQNNFVKQSGAALYAYGNAAHIAIGNIIRGNIIGTETDSLIAFGIVVFHSQNTIIENNIVQNLRLANSWDASNVGILSLFDLGDIIRNNIVHNVKSSTGYSSVGIFLSGEAGYVGSNNSVYNNMVYDIQSTSTQGDSRVTGIQMFYQNNPKIYYNSVYLDGNGNGANPNGSAALYISNYCTNVDAKNNILVNTRDESPYCASSIYNYTTSNLTSDYNDLFYEPSQYNCLVRIGSTKYNTLADWQATGKDLNSIFEMPNFIDPYLHIDSNIPTNIESHAIPIAGITTDFDGDVRNAATPDIGADEFQGVEGITWTSQTLPDNDLMIQVKAVDLSVAWALGLHGGIFRTTNGGTTWISVESPLQLAEQTMLCIDATSATTAFVGGLNYDLMNVPPNDTTFIWRTTDGGGTWSVVFAQLHGFIDAVNMISVNEGIGLGDPVGGKWTIISTTDSGKTWSRISTEPSQVGEELGWFHSLCTDGPDHIWFGTYVGSNNTASIYRSIDGGDTWSREETPLSNGAFSVWFKDALYGVCIGDSISVRSTDGGITWATIEDLPGGHWYDDLFPTILISGGKDFWAVVDKVVYRSTDLGASWYISYAGVNDTLTYASFVTVGDYTAGWVTSLGNKIVACNFYDPATDVHEIVNGEILTEFKLSQNYPNPFNPSTTIRYSIPNESKVIVKVYDILGKEIETLVNEEKPAGTFEVTWNAANLPSGVYFYQIRAGEYVDTKKMILIK